MDKSESSSNESYIRPDFLPSHRKSLNNRLEFSSKDFKEPLILLYTCRKSQYGVSKFGLISKYSPISFGEGSIKIFASFKLCGSFAISETTHNVCLWPDFDEALKFWKINPLGPLEPAIGLKSRKAFRELLSCKSTREKQKPS